MKTLSLLVALFFCSAAQSFTVCIDPGHGGSEPGASGTWYLEKNANLDVAFAAASYLALVPECEWTGMTRTGDYTVSLAARVAYANANGFDRYMAIHENAFNTTTQGTETFCYSLDPATPGFDLASEVLGGILWAHSYSSRGVKDGSWIYVVANTNMTAILGEGTFIDYNDQWNESYRYYTNMNDHIGRQGYAYALGICQHLGITPPAYGFDDIIVDNLSSGFAVNSQTEWNTGSYGQPWSTDYRWSSTTNQSDWARWTPAISEAGWYQVSVWYTQGSNRAPDAVYTVHHTGGETEFTVDQTQGGEQWAVLGSFCFDSGTAGWVTLSEAGSMPDRVVIADAVKFHMSSTAADEDTFAEVAGSVQMTVSPNPGTSFQVKLDLPSESEVSVVVYDISGRIVETIAEAAVLRGENTVHWNPSGVPAGVYVVRAVSPEWSISRRIAVSQ